jgi:acetyl-CoA carboxylase biotin carboxyl carrier protein
VDSKELKELMEYISRSNFAEFEIESEGLKLKLVKESARAGGNSTGPMVAQAYYAPYPLPPGAPQAAPQAIAPASQGAPAPQAQGSTGGEIYQVTSPMVGTFYRAANPNAPPYVEVGSMVKKGQALCIVEAMKLMNEIESEVSGEILEVPVANGQPVEYGEVLFRVRLSS